jgi:NAD(P)-dependent dehydrogenase (short-subunit alcohol dehydrogenase family)
MKTWFITGTSRGFGREWTKAALKRGDKVAATARNIDTLKDLVDEYGDAILPIKLDVTNHDDDFAAVKFAFDYFGEIDIVINNAGYCLFGTIEEVTEKQARTQIETNLFGPLWISQAALPYLRKQGYGHIIQVSSIGGVGAFATLGLYHASKWGLEGFSEALASEVAEFGVFVTLVEPGGYSTDVWGSSSVQTNPNPAYDKLRDFRKELFKSAKYGDPRASAGAILKLVDSENPPLRLLLGESVTKAVKDIYAQRLEIWTQWEDVSIAADGE